MASSTTTLCLCTLTFTLFIGGICAFPTRLLSEYEDDSVSTEDFITDTEIQILSDIEDELKSIKGKLLAIDQLKALRVPEVPAASSDRFGLDVMTRRRDPEEMLLGERDRRGSWDTTPERETEVFLTSPKEQLLDMIKLYNYLQSQRDSDASSYRTSKRQPPTGFHAVRGKRPSPLRNFPSIKRPSSFDDFPVSRRDPPVRGFSAVRGKK